MLQFITPRDHIPCPKLWKEFSAAQVERAVLDITGLGLYRAFLNGQRVGQDYLTPGCNDYDAYLRYQTYDVTDLLQADNRLEVWLGNGWYKGRFGLGTGENIWGDRYLLAARLTLTLTDGTERVLDTDDTWLAARSPIVDGNIYDGEVRDDTLPEGTPIPCVPADTPYHPEPQFSPAIRARAELHPTLLITPASEQVLDFGQNAAGIIRFVNRLPKGAVMRIQTGEVLQNDCFYRDNLRSARSEYIYTSGGVVETIEPLFTFYGFRYAKVEGIEHVDPADFTAIALCSDLRETLTVQTSHPLLDQLLQNALWGQRSNFLDVPTDCPQRDERLGWTADTQVFVNTACYQMDCKAFYAKFMRDMREDQLRYYDGDFPMYSPSIKGWAGHGGAVWADAGTIVPWELYMNYGDTALLAQHYPGMRDFAEYLIGLDRRDGGTHLVYNSFTFGDWLAQDGLTDQSVKGGTEEAFIQGVYYMNSIRLTAQAAQVLGYAEDAAHYAALADDIRASLLDEYVTPGGRLALDTQTSYVLALHYGLWRDKEKLLQGLRARLQKDFFKITCGFTGAPLMLPVLLDNGLVDEAYRMLLTEEFPGWLYCVKLGATTVWERWNSLEADGTVSGTGMNSFNHYAYGSVCEAVYSRIMGLQNDAPGWTRARIAPKLNGQLRHASIAYDSPAGHYAVAWRILDDGQVTLSAQIPEGAQATIVLPDHPDGSAITVGAGEHVYTYQPTVDYLHPYSTASLMMDLLANPAAAEVLREALPNLFDPHNLTVSREVTVLRLADRPFGLPNLPPEQLAALDEKLRRVARQ